MVRDRVTDPIAKSKQAARKAEAASLSVPFDLVKESLPVYVLVSRVEATVKVKAVEEPSVSNPLVADSAVASKPASMPMPVASIFNLPSKSTNSSGLR